MIVGATVTTIIQKTDRSKCPGISRGIRVPMFPALIRNRRTAEVRRRAAPEAREAARQKRRCAGLRLFVAEKMAPMATTIVATGARRTKADQRGGHSQPPPRRGGPA